MKCTISLKELYGKEVETYEEKSKKSGDEIQNMEDKLSKEKPAYNIYSLTYC